MASFSCFGGSFANTIFASGAGLEEFLQPLLESAGATERVVEVSAGIALIASQDPDEPGDDPHTWMDPDNVITWVANIQAALTRVDSAHADAYREIASVLGLTPGSVPVLLFRARRKLAGLLRKKGYGPGERS